MNHLQNTQLRYNVINLTICGQRQSAFLQHLKVGMPKTPMVITMILGSSFETRLRSALSLSNGSLMPFLTKPYALIFVVATIVTIGLPVVKAVLKKSKAKA